MNKKITLEDLKKIQDDLLAKKSPVFDPKELLPDTNGILAPSDTNGILAPSWSVKNSQQAK